MSSTGPVAITDALAPLTAESSSTASAHADSRTAWIALIMLFTIYFCGMVDRSIFGIIAQPMKEDLLLADWELGFLTGMAFSLVHLLFGFPMARLSDKGSRVTILSICTAFWSVMTAACGLCQSFLQLTFARMGVGVGEAACFPASQSLISDYFPPAARTKALAIYGLGFPVGSFAGVLIGGFVLDHWGWRAVFYVVGLPGILVALLARYIVKEPVRGRFDTSKNDDPTFADPKSYKDVLLIIWRSPILRQTILALTLLSTFTSPTGTFVGVYMARKFPLSYTELGFIMAMSMMLGASLSTIIGGGIIAQWLGRKDQRWLQWFPAISVATGMPLYVIALFQENWLAFAIWMFFGALANATFFAPSFTVIYNIIPPGGRARAAVLISSCMSVIGGSLGPLLAGLGNDLLAARLFGDFAPQGFAAACPGGQAIKGGGAALDAACRASVLTATQIVLIVTMTLTIWPAWHFYVAGRRMKKQGTVAATLQPA